MPMPEPPISWERVKGRVAAMLQTTAASLPAAWDSLCAEATRDAANDVATLLAAKGYSAGEIAAADQYPYWVELLAAVLSLRRGSVLASYPQDALDKLDPTERIERAGFILVGGTATAPSGGTDVGGIGYGSIAALDLVSDDADTAADDPAAPWFG